MYDFSAMMKQAQQVVDNSSEGRSYKYQILYPGPGVTTVRLLFNPKSGIATRLIQRHRIGESQVPCLRTYGQECPICKAIENVKNATGTELKCKSQSRGISFAQFVSADHKVGTEKNPIKTKDIVLLMYPWSVYQELNKFIQMISQSPEGMAQFFTKASGSVHSITRDENNKYSVMMNPYTPFQSAENDEEFDHLLDSCEDLNEQILPSTPTQEIIDQVNKAAQAIEDDYLNVSSSPNIINPNQGQAMDMNVMMQQIMAQSAQQGGSAVTTPNPAQASAPVMTAQPQMNAVPVQSTPIMGAGTVTGTPVMNNPGYVEVAPTQSAQQSVASVANSGKPQCFTKHNPDDLNCQICPIEMECKAQTTESSGPPF